MNAPSERTLARARRALLPALAATLAGCASFAAPQPQTLATVAPMRLAGDLPGRFELELTSPGLTGTFDGVCAVGDGWFRVQLFPDVGGKVLDVVVDGDRVRADLAGVAYEAAAPLDAAPPHLALVVAALFAELLAPVDGTRVLGERSTDGGIEVALRPALGSGDVVAVLAPSGVVARCRVRLGRIEFTLHADGTLDGNRFGGRLRPVGD